MPRLRWKAVTFVGFMHDRRNVPSERICTIKLMKEFMEVDALFHVVVWWVGCGALICTFHDSSQKGDQPPFTVQDENMNCQEVLGTAIQRPFPKVYRALVARGVLSRHDVGQGRFPT